jgi:pimeloyl-ACP methyl ester carboxylesterase
MTIEIKQLKCLGPTGFHRIAYAEWTGRAGRPTICVHGLTRNGRDFDALARRLSASGGPVLAPDMPGRGKSEWLPSADSYQYPVYFADVAALIARSGADEIDFVGTSMGGIIGMYLASQPGTPIRRLVLNDVGPFIPKASLQRIGGHLGLDPKFPDIAALEAYIRQVQGSFGALSGADWRHLAETGHRVLPDGMLGLAYDPAIAGAFKAALEDVSLWEMYDPITCPTLVIRGAQSDLLLAETAAEMTRRGPCATLFEVADAGHAPALMATDQIDAIEAFLRAEAA